MRLGPVLILETFTFPLPPKDSLDFDMKRELAKIDFPGGPPVYQDMGMGEKTLDFSGSIVGDNALDSSLEIETLWWSGKELQFSYGDLQKRVRIQSYRPKIRREDRVDYSIQLVVCFPESELANAQPGTAIPQLVDGSPPDIDQVYDRQYTVKSGDTLWDIASKADVFGDGSKWELIASANGITDEYNLQVGQLIKIPSASNAVAAEQSQTLERKRVLSTMGKEELNQIMLDQELSDQMEMDQARRIGNGEL